MNNAKINFELLAEEEKELEFEKFSRKDALEVGLLINKNAKQYPDPITIEITINGLVVFRYFSEGSIPDSEFWLARKRNSINLMSMSSLRFMYWLQMHGATLADRKLNADNYAPAGGGFPIKIKGTGIIGSICVSGLPDHLDDHKLVVDSLKEFLEIAE